MGTGEVRGIGHYYRFSDYRRGVGPFAGLIGRRWFRHAAAFVGRDWSRSGGCATRASCVTPPKGHNSGIPKATTANDVLRLLSSCDIGDPLTCDHLIAVTGLGLRSKWRHVHRSSACSCSEKLKKNMQFARHCPTM